MVTKFVRSIASIWLSHKVALNFPTTMTTILTVNPIGFSTEATDEFGTTYIFAKQSARSCGTSLEDSDKLPAEEFVVTLGTQS